MYIQVKAVYVATCDKCHKKTEYNEITGGIGIQLPFTECWHYLPNGWLALDQVQLCTECADGVRDVYSKFHCDLHDYVWGYRPQ